jgi:hypothetical protein
MEKYCGISRNKEKRRRQANLSPTLPEKTLDHFVTVETADRCATLET